MLDHFFDMLDALAVASLNRPPKRTPIAIWVKEMDNARDCRLCRQTAIVTGQCQRAERCSVIRTIACQNLMPARIEACNFDGVLICFRPAECKECFLQISRSDFSQLLSQQTARFCCHAGAGESQLRGLFLNCFDHFRVLMSYICIHQL